MAAHDHRAAAQRGVVALLDGRVERVHVEVDDRGGYSPASSIFGRFDFLGLGASSLAGASEDEDDDGWSDPPSVIATDSDPAYVWSIPPPTMYVSVAFEWNV